MKHPKGICSPRGSLARAILAMLLVACGDRTQLMFGVATDLRAPDALDTVQLDVIRVDNGFVEQSVFWDLSGSPSEPFNLPGSYGVFSEGEEIQLDLRLTGIKNTETLVSRRSIVTLVEGETLFYRLGLTAGCIGREDCPETHSCVEGVCRDINVPSNQLPQFREELVEKVSCSPGANYLHTDTGMPMEPTDDALECPAGLCLEGTCLKPPPAESGTRTVRGSKIRTFILPDNQTSNVPDDLSTLEVAAIVTDKDGEVSTLPGLGLADGTFAIQSVPHGTYTLKVGTTYTVTAADNVDLGTVDLGRPNKTAVTNTATGMNFNVTGMTSWQAGDLLTGYSPDANDWWFFVDRTNPPLLGQTTLTNFVLNFNNISDGRSLIAGDQFGLVQYTNKAAGDVDATKYQAATKLLTPTPFTMVEGQLTQVSGAFADVPQTSTISFDVRQREWENTVGWDGTNPLLLNPTATAFDISAAGVTGKLGGLVLTLFGQPGGSTYGPFSSTIDYLFLTAPEGKDSTFSNLTYGKPHVSNYAFGQVLSSGVGYSVAYQLPGTTNPVQQFLFVNTLRSADTDLLIVNPILGPVRDATINGVNIFTSQQNVPPTSRISWKAPALGTASIYTVNFQKLGVGANNSTNQKLAAFVTTTDTFLDIPPGILESGQSYFFVIAATNGGNIDAPSRRRLPEALTPVASAIITIGVGGVEPGTMIDAGIDAPTSGFCDLVGQTGCSAGLKCGVLQNQPMCQPNGAISIDGTCTGTNESNNCTSGGICIFQTCRAFCPQDGSAAGCAGNETCHQFGGFNSCLTNCNSLAPSCPTTAAGSQGCYETLTGGECITSASNIAIGGTCTFLNDCTAGSGCLNNVCLKYCDFAQFPDVQGPCNAGQTCQLHNANNNVGVCL